MFEAGLITKEEKEQDAPISPNKDLHFYYSQGNLFVFYNKFNDCNSSPNQVSVYKVNPNNGSFTDPPYSLCGIFVEFKKETNTIYAMPFNLKELPDNPIIFTLD